ncbi:M48 family metallopeptidase [Deltaproteobacteria bacterium]|nr:M48 family metallopeptidase [Deltaproteobacteria bacterium]
MITINFFLSVYLTIYLIVSVTDIIIDLINDAHLRKHGKEVPPGFEGIIDEEKLGQINDYTVDNNRLAVARTIAGKIVFLFIILSGFLPWLSEILKETNFILAGLIFFTVPGLAGALVDLPFNYYHIFRIEERYGFNTRTVKTWIADLLKSLIITVILGTILLSLLLVMVEYTGSSWWFWAWLIFFLFQILMSILYPTIIAPVFNKFTPVKDNDLDKSIRELADREGINVKGIFQMDAGKRSRHTNAYFSGLGKSKRIVLYDTLLESHKKDEILAVLAHEIGHLKKGHIRKQVVIISAVSFILFFIASRMISWNFMYESFGFSSMPLYAGLFLIAVIWEPVGFFLSPFSMAISRKFEREADHYVYRSLKSAEYFISALKKMALDNLSNLCPHPLYVCFNYSHPPLPERIKNLEKLGQDLHA